MPVFRGTYYERFVTLLDENDDPIPITDWTFEAGLRDQDGTLYVTLDTANGGVTVGDANGGIIRIAISPELSEQLPEDTILFDVIRTDHSSGPIWLFSGRFRAQTPQTNLND